MKKGADYIGVGCGAVIYNEQREILLGLRGAHAGNDQGKWSIPGGGVEFGEKRSDAVMREIEEEISCKVEVVRELGIFDHFIPEGNFHWVTTTFLCRLVGGEVQNMEPDKCEKFQWFSLEEAKKLPLSAHLPEVFDVLEKELDCGGEQTPPTPSRGLEY